LPSVAGGELVGFPLHVGRRVGPYIDQHIVDRTRNAAKKLDLLMRMTLEVHAPNGAGARSMRDAVLHEHSRQASDSELMSAEGAREIPSLVLCLLELYQPYVLQTCGVKQHSSFDHALPKRLCQPPIGIRQKHSHTLGPYWLSTCRPLSASFVSTESPATPETVDVTARR
jgi:hypothetical protein